jgi:hypothetical protein
MSQLEEKLVARWGAYELNVAALLSIAPFMAILSAAFTLLPSMAFGMLASLPLFGGPAISYWLMLIGLCPDCNKSPMIGAAGEKHAWPERYCSACGRDLKVPE